MTEGQKIVEMLDKAFKDPTNYTVVILVRIRKFANEVQVASCTCLVEGYLEFEESETLAKSEEAFNKRQRILDVIMDEMGLLKSEYWLHPLSAHKLLKAGAGLYAITLINREAQDETKLSPAQEKTN